MLYDGDCGFCRKWIEKWRKITEGAVAYIPYQEGLARFPQVTEEQCKEAVQLVMEDGRVFSGAHAVFHSFALAGKHRWLLWLYEHAPFFGRTAEVAYHLVASHRTMLSKFFKKPPTCNM